MIQRYEDSFQRSSQTKETLQQLRKEIIFGKYKPGTRLIEAKLAENMGISRAPIRTAFQMLAQEGLVLNLSNGGTEVIGCSSKDVADMFELRLVMEKEALRIAFDNPSFHYRPLFDAMEMFDEYKKKFEATSEITSNDTSQLDILFHRSLIMMADSNPLRVAWNTMANILQTILEITNTTRPTFREFYEDHRMLADMIIQKKREECFKELEFHITNAKNIIIERIDQAK